MAHLRNAQNTRQLAICVFVLMFYGCSTSAKWHEIAHDDKLKHPLRSEDYIAIYTTQGHVVEGNFEKQDSTFFYLDSRKVVHKIKIDDILKIKKLEKYRKLHWTGELLMVVVAGYFALLLLVYGFSGPFPA